MAQVAQLALALTPPYPVSEEQKLEWLRKGRIIHYPAERPVHLSVSSWDSIRTVRAGMLLSLFDRASRSCPVPIRLKHAIIEGDFRLRHLICSFEFSATEECAFTSEVDFSYTKFDGILDLSSASFAKRARLDFAHCGYDLRLNRAEFLDEASFVGISVGGRLNGRGACFSSRANFAGIHCSQIASFRSETPDQLDQGITTFTKDAAFLDAKFDGTIDFDGVQFAGKLDFSRCSVAGNAFFRPVHLLGSHHRMPVRFMGTVSFTDSVIGGSAVFEFAEFGKELRLNRARVGGGLYCKEALFGPGARAVFDNLQTGGPAFFDGAQFAAAVNFESVQIKGSLSFRGNVDKTLPTRFGDAASFKDCVIGGNASFGGANFWGWGEPSKRVAADFSRVRIGGSAFFGALGTAGQSLLQTRFMGKAYFDDLSVQGVCIFGGALFSGDLYFRRAQVGSSTYFAPIEIGEQMAHTYLAGASNFHESRFHGSIDFRGVHFGGDSNWDRCTVDGAAFFRPFRTEHALASVVFVGKASFRDTQISGIADFSGVDFNEEVAFLRAKLGAGIFFSTVRPGGTLVVARFRRGLRMFRSQVNGDLQMEGSQHDELAELESVQVKGNLLCRSVMFPAINAQSPEQLSVTRFNKGARFLAAVVDGSADFSEVEFGGFANFMFARVGGPTFFRKFSNQTVDHTVMQGASFQGAVLTGGAEFEGVSFQRALSLVETRVGGSCRFQRVHLNDRADFSRCEVQGDAYFDQDVRFRKVSFEGARFGKRCLCDGAQFQEDVNFSRARVESLLSFDSAQFHGNLSLEDSTVDGVSLDLPRSEFWPHAVTLKGFTYTRMNSSWRDLFRRMPDDPEGERHLQAYTQLEKYFRSSGYERDADEVYLARRKAEWQLLFDRVLSRRSEPGSSWLRTLFRFGEESAVRFIFNYGVPSYRLIVFAVVLFLAGVFVLSHPSAVVPRADLSKVPARVSTWDYVRTATGAFFASVVPGERSKIFTAWQPSFQKMWSGGPSYAQLATGLSLLIYLCLTTAVASLAGLIKRRHG